MPTISNGSIRRFCAMLAALVAMMAALPSIGAAQGGRVTGTVTGANNRPIADAKVVIVNTSYRATTDANGKFTINGVPSGRYELRVARIGEQPRTILIDVGSGETLANVQLTRAAVDLGGITVSASRRAEKVTEAPATVTVINTEMLDATVGNTFASALKEAKGIDFIQVGMTAVAINARGFNSAFNNRFLMVEDGRIAVLPENGLPVGAFTPTPKVDLAGMEVLVGPGSALYGPDASNGVLSLTTKDPRQYPGGTLEVSGGSRSYRDIQGRFAGMFSDQIGFKVAGEYQAANDWENYLSYNVGGSIVPAGTAGALREDALKAPISWDTGVKRGTAALVYYAGANRLEVNGGASVTDAVGQTNVGRNQLDGWKYNVLQARFTSPRWFFNAYRTQSQSGNSYALNRYAGAQLTAANASLSADSLRMLSDWPSNGRMYAAEAQGNYTVIPLLNTSFVFGAQYRRDQVSSDRQWLTDRITGEDIKNDQKGIYAQSTTPVMPWLDVVLAGRLDYPESYDRQFSPKAGVVVKPLPDQAFRVTFNRAYKSPTILQTDFFIPDWTSIISIFGNTTGFLRTNLDGSTVTYNPMKPETNKTWEFGYKGVLVGRLFVDGTYFRSDYKNFMSPLTIIQNPFNPAAAGGAYYAKPLNAGGNIPVNAQGRIVNQATVPLTPIVLTYYNLGDAKVSGVDLGLSALVTNQIELRTTASTVKIDEVTVPAGGSLEAVSLNSPTTKWTVGATAHDFGPVTGGLTWRNVNGYYFRSGTNTGVIPAFGTLDASLSVKIPTMQNVLVNLSVGNLFTCSARNVTYSPVSAQYPQPSQHIATEDRKCGLDRKHAEMINMPEIGMMAFLGVRFNVNPTLR